MTRKEEIRQYLKERNIPITSLEANSIIEGIEWVDEHPKEGLVSIEKAAEWVKNSFKGTFGEGLAENIKQEFIEAMTK